MRDRLLVTVDDRVVRRRPAVALDLEQRNLLHLRRRRILPARGLMARLPSGMPLPPARVLEVPAEGVPVPSCAGRRASGAGFVSSSPLQRVLDVLYGAVMLIAVLLFAETTVMKLAVHGITPEEVRQVNDGDRIVIRNPRPRVEGSVLMIGRTHGGRVLTVVLNPESADVGLWHVRTAWNASPAQIGRYQRDR